MTQESEAGSLDPNDLYKREKLDKQDLTALGWTCRSEEIGRRVPSPSQPPGLSTGT